MEDFLNEKTLDPCQLLFDNTLKTLILLGLELFHSLQDFFPNGLVAKTKDTGHGAGLIQSVIIALGASGEMPEMSQWEHP
jgi:hypothetical protein